MKKLISLIIVHWNTPEILKKQLRQLAISNNFQIIVVDNASDKPLDWLKKDFPQVELIENKFNRGYAFACNQGLIRAKNKWLLFLNPDVEIDENQIEMIIDYAEKNHLDACSPTVGENYQKPIPTWFSLLTEFSPLHYFYDFTCPSEVPSVVEGRRRMNSRTLFGGCLLIKKTVLLELGGWDERFFLWFEDSDLTTRLIKNNYQIGFTSPASLHRLGGIGTKHIGGQSFKLISSQTQRDIFFHSMDIFAKKHFSWWGKLIVGLIKKRYTSRKLLPVLNNVISITVPNLNKKLLEMFFSQNLYTAGVGEEWTVVTSAIDQQEVWEWRKKYPKIRFTPIDKNYGFASTVNIGFRVSTGKWIGTVNDDTVLKKNWINECLLAADEKTGSINPIIYNKNGKIETAGINILSYGKAIKNTVLTNSPHIQATNAAAVIYSKRALNKVGLFDERFGSYLEDIDLSLRLSRSGFKNIVSLKSSVAHLGQSSSTAIGSKKQFYDFRNWIYIILKNWGLKKIILNFPAIVIERLRNLSGIAKAIFDR